MARRGALALCIGGALCIAAPPALAAPTPTVVTGPATEITQTSARITGTVNPNGGPTRYHFSTFDFGFPIDRLSHDAGAGTAPVQVTSLLTGLLPGQTYAFRLAAVNADGDETDGNTVSFMTLKPTCVVPKLKGLTSFDAALKLENAHCALGRRRYRNLGRGINRVLNRLNSRVVSQSPRPGRRLPGDSKVNLVLAPKHPR
jgi:hypothetical protein